MGEFVENTGGFMNEIKREVMLDFALEGLINAMNFLETQEPLFLNFLEQSNKGYEDAAKIRFNNN